MTQTNTGLSGPTILLPKKNVILDATLLSAIMSCPRMADLRYNHNLQSAKGKSNSLETGSIVHKGLEVAYKLIMNGHARNNSYATGLVAAQLYADGCPHCTSFVSSPEQVRPVCGHEVDEYPGVINTPQESEGYQIGVKWAITTLEQYFEYYKNDFWVTLGVETVEGKVLYEDDELRILWKAKLDWKVDTNQGIFPVDHKTSKQRRQKIKLNNQFMGQCLVTGTRAMIINEIGFQKTLKPIEKFLRPMMSYTSEALLEWQGTTLPYYAYKLIEFQESSYYPPNMTHCENKYGNCAFIEACESDPPMRESVLRMNFIKGADWNPVNANSGTNDED